VAYLPGGISPNNPQLWPEAAEIESEPREAITYTSRFRKPDWWIGE
jgi:hypothetical protein